VDGRPLVVGFGSAGRHPVEEAGVVAGHAVGVGSVRRDDHGVAGGEDAAFAGEPDVQDAVENVKGFVLHLVADERRFRAHAAGDVGGAEDAARVRRAGDDGDQLAVDLVAGAFP
jgi:hypothetical protein